MLVVAAFIKNTVGTKGTAAVSNQVSQEQTAGALEELKIQDEIVGTGVAAKSGDVVEVHYTGKLTDGTVFDSSVPRNTPFKFTIGAGQVIKGWDEGIPGMKVGGKRILTIPSTLAYGAEGQGPIPPNSTLIFEVQLLKIVTEGKG